jgi:general secretion pathway protein M
MSAALMRLWAERTPRERVLLGVMLALVAALLLWLLVLRPFGDMLSAARERHGQAVAQLARAREQAALIRSLERQGGGATIRGPIEIELGRAAAAAGFQLGGLQAAGEGRVAVAIPAARPQALFGWLAQLERSGFLVERFEASANSDRSLAVQATLRARAG